MEELHGSDEVHSMTAAFSQIINVPYQDSNWWNAKIKNIDEKLIEKYRINEELRNVKATPLRVVALKSLLVL